MKKPSCEDFYFKLQDVGHVRVSLIPDKVRYNQDFRDLLEAATLERKPFGSGNAIFIKDPTKYQKWLDLQFPKGRPKVSEKATKEDSETARKQFNSHVIHVRGWRDIRANEQLINLRQYTQFFNLFGGKIKELKADKLCFVENEDIFLRAEKIISESYVLFHSYGRLTEEVTKGLNAKEMLVFPDYDYIGLDAYLLLKERFPNAVLYMPKNYDDLYEKYSVPLEQKKQLPSKRVLDSTEPIVIKIRGQLEQNHLFLEQSILFDNLRPR